jgi:hypothetical protein
VFQQPITRNQVSTEELEWIFRWIMNQSPVRNGKEGWKPGSVKTAEQHTSESSTSEE